MARQMILGDALLKVLREVGIVDDNTYRCVIDIRAGHIPTVYIERFGARELIDVIRATAMVEIEVVSEPCTPVDLGDDLHP